MAGYYLKEDSGIDEDDLPAPLKLHRRRSIGAPPPFARPHVLDDGALAQRIQPCKIKALIPLAKKPGMATLGPGDPPSSLQPLETVSFTTVRSPPTTPSTPSIFRRPWFGELVQRCRLSFAWESFLCQSDGLACSLGRAELEAALAYGNGLGQPGLIGWLTEHMEAQHGLKEREEGSWGICATVGRCAWRVARLPASAAVSQCAAC